MAKFLKRALLFVLGAVVVFGAVMAIILGVTLSKTSKALTALTIEPIDVSRLRDGVYDGFYDGGLVKAKVRATVSRGRITDLTILKHDHGRGGKAESIVETVVQAQSLAVDTVTGATGSSKVLLKATEIALKQGLSE